MEEALTEDDVKRRAKTGIFFVGSWGVLNLVVGFGGNLVLARLLEPRDFGRVAIGATLMMFTTSIADGGLGSGLIRRETSPDRQELKAALALQLLLTTTLAALAAIVGWAIGGAGLIVALMLAALPIASFQTPARVMLSRALRFKALSTAEAASNLLYYAWAIAMVVLAGAGVWALASAVVVRAVALTAGVSIAWRGGLPLPSLKGAAALRPVIMFGLRFQGVSFVGMLREQGLNVGIAAVSGVATLGIWTLTRRLLEIPALMFEPLHRVSFPVLSHTLATKQDPARLLDRGIAVAGAASGIVLVAMATASPELVPFLFGEQWRAAGTVIPWICGALLVAGPISVAAVGYLYASDAPSVVLRATVIHSAVLLAVALPLLGPLGPEAIGIGSFSGALVDAAILGTALARRSGARPAENLLPTLAIAAVAVASGLAVDVTSGPDVLTGIAAGTMSAVVFVALHVILRRHVVLDTVHLLGDAVRTSLRSEPEPEPEPRRRPVVAEQAG